MKPLLLASASPRRTELLRRAGIEFATLAVHFPPELEKIEPLAGVAETVEAIAARKLERTLLETSVHAVIVCADTVVAVGGRILGKPVSAADAADMLHALSGRVHDVYTAVAAADTATGKRGIFHERTSVRFRAIGDDEIRAYVATGEPFDKAGAYGIQERASLFVSGIEGCWANVVGLPVARLAEFLREEMNHDVTRQWRRGA